LSNRPPLSPIPRIEDTHGFDTLAVCHVLIHPIALGHTYVKLPTQIDLINALSDRMLMTEDAELYDLRSRLAQEIGRTVERLEFTTCQITAFYRTKRESRFSIKDSGMPLIVIDGDAAPGDDANAYNLNVAQRRARSRRLSLQAV
jgi:hypothetical protein